MRDVVRSIDIGLIFSVGYDTVKLYHDTDADTFAGKVSWYWYILHVSW